VHAPEQLAFWRTALAPKTPAGHGFAVAELVVRESSSDWSAELPAAAAPTLSNATVDLKQMLADFESAWIREAMKVTEGNITHAAELLGLARTTLIERLRKYDLSVSRQ
jgi:DNA-binding NtrC family response regulator